MTYPGPNLVSPPRLVYCLFVSASLGCGDGVGFLTLGPGAADDTTTTASTGAEPTTSAPEATDTSGEAAASTVDPPGLDTGAPGCEPGDVGCTCIGLFCRPGGTCWLGECAPLTGECPELELNGVCDEGAECPAGSDPFDCCANPQDGTCEEHSAGGVCPKGADFWDCGYCPTPANGECDVVCPPSTDEFDCCPTRMDGVCEEEGQGGGCPDDSDFYDCGACPFAGDGWCDEPFVCPPGSDTDCCATIEDGVCEEASQGGRCADESDFHDCGYCPMTGNGLCNEPLCPPGSDADDCCATVMNGVCEEEGQGGDCLDGTDFYDCGECPDYHLDNDFCEEPFYCPPGSDAFDCCPTTKDGVCEELAMGGACPDGSDPYDCGVCPTENDWSCDEPQACPIGSDEADCCATPEDGTCEEVGEGGSCPDGSDYYDCGVCPFLNDGSCDEPHFCPPGSDLGDCV